MHVRTSTFIVSNQGHENSVSRFLQRFSPWQRKCLPSPPSSTSCKCQEKLASGRKLEAISKPPSWYLHLLRNACHVNCSLFCNLYVLQGSRQLALSTATNGFIRPHSYTCLLLCRSQETASANALVGISSILQWINDR